jgi:predicted small lipoprotein YifL
MMKRMDGGIRSGTPLHKLALLLGLAATLAGCGRIGDLQPAPGQALPVKPKMARTTPTPEELLTPPPYARPERIDEILRRNVPRTADRFDLPPPDGGAAPAAETEAQADSRTDDPGPATPQ